jgi:hypothetical protein
VVKEKAGYEQRKAADGTVILRMFGVIVTEHE